MSIEIVEMRGNTSLNYDLKVTQVGMVVTVGAGTVVHPERSFTLEEDQVFTATSRSTSQEIWADVVEVVGTGAVVLFVCEVLPGETGYDFSEGSYRHIVPVFRMKVPADAVDLDIVEIKTYKRVISSSPPEEEVQDG